MNKSCNYKYPDIHFGICLLIFLLIAFKLSAGEKVLEENSSSQLINWEKPLNRYITISDGQLENKTSNSSEISLKNKNIGEFTISFQLKFLENPDTTPGHFSIGIERGYGKWILYFSRHGKISQITSLFNPPGLTGGNHAIFNEVIKTPLPLGEWLNITINCSKDLYELRIGDRSFILGAAPGEGGISFASYKQPFIIKDIKLSCSAPEKLSKNMLINSSFEFATNPDIPDEWAGNGERYRTNGIPLAICDENGLSDFHKKFRIDDNQAFHGKKSIWVEYPFYLMSKGVKVSSGKNYVVSFYIKSDLPDSRVLLAAFNESINKPVNEKTVSVTKKWQRFELPLPAYPHSLISVLARPSDGGGGIWIDAVQLEENTSVSQYMPCWLDSGFMLPPDVNKNQCSNNTNAVKSYRVLPKNLVAETPLEPVAPLKLTCINPSKSTFSITVPVMNNGKDKIDSVATVIVSSKNSDEKIKSQHYSLLSEQETILSFDDLNITEQRCKISFIITDSDGKILLDTRDIVYVPRPVRIYPEYSFYSKETKARIIVEINDSLNIPEDCKLNLEAFVTGYPQYICQKISGELKKSQDRVILTMPLSRLKPNNYSLRLSITNSSGNTIATGDGTLLVLKPRQTEAKINLINRGIYLNGKPFIPYGILVSNISAEQLRYYRDCGFSFIQFISHWNSPQLNMEFLDNCEKQGIKALAFHVSRPFVMPPHEAAELYRPFPAFVGIIPSDESADRIVCQEAEASKLACPERLVWVNHHFISYRAFASRLDGFPGDLLSIDRYPFIMQPPGRPQTTNDIYSFERCLEIMDSDSKNERKPVLTWLQGAERFSKEPTPTQLTWQMYTALVNHCMGFTYFGGIPNSKIVWDRMISLNRELEVLTPALFSLEDEPLISIKDQATKENIRIMAKRLGNELTIICVNRSLNAVNAVIDLSSTGSDGAQTVEVLFEQRKLEVGKDGTLKDTFAPLERHVYTLKLKESETKGVSIP